MIFSMLSAKEDISIHASLAGGDGFNGFNKEDKKYFNPRLPRGRRRTTALRTAADCSISIHASLAGGDPQTPSITSSRLYFNPGLPRGRRHDIAAIERNLLRFQSTPPSREATLLSTRMPSMTQISIHASLAGGDLAR